jgi:hypothetical protein
MTPKVPSWLFVTGGLLCGLTIEAKKHLPDILGRSTPFQWGCSIASDILLSAGLFLSLYGLFCGAGNRATFSFLTMCNLGALLALQSFYFFGYVGWTKIDSFTGALPSVLPKLVENAKTADSEAKRVKMAENAYKLYGVSIAYRRDSGEFLYYEPSQEDLAFYQQMIQTTKTKADFHELVQGQLRQFPYLFGFSVVSFFLTFAVGTLWVVLKGTV